MASRGDVHDGSVGLRHFTGDDAEGVGPGP